MDTDANDFWAAEVLLSLKYARVFGRNAPTLTSDADRADTSPQRDPRPRPPPLQMPTLSAFNSLSIGTAQANPAPHHDIPPEPSTSVINPIAPIGPTNSLGLHFHRSDSPPWPVVISGRLTRSPHHNSSYGEPIHGWSSAQRTASGPAAPPLPAPLRLGPTLDPLLTASPINTLRPIRRTSDYPTAGPLSPARRVSGPSPTVPKSFQPPHGDGNSPPSAARFHTSMPARPRFDGNSSAAAAPRVHSSTPTRPRIDENSSPAPSVPYNPYSRPSLSSPLGVGFPPQAPLRSVSGGARSVPVHQENTLGDAAAAHAQGFAPSGGPVPLPSGGPAPLATAAPTVQQRAATRRVTSQPTPARLPQANAAAVPSRAKPKPAPRRTVTATSNSTPPAHNVANALSLRHSPANDQPVAGPSWSLPPSSDDGLDSGSEFQPEEMEVDELDSDTDGAPAPPAQRIPPRAPRATNPPRAAVRPNPASSAPPPPPRQRSRHEQHLQDRRTKETASHEHIVAAKLANFRAGKIYSFAPDHPRYDPSTNMDPALRKHWHVWGTQESKYALEREIYIQMSTLQQRLIATHATRAGTPHRDLPKAVRTRYYEDFTDLVEGSRSEEASCNRCIVGGFRCCDPTVKKEPKGTLANGEPKTVCACMGCQSSKGGCKPATVLRAPKKGMTTFDYQVWHDRKSDPAAWPQFPPIDLDGLPEPFPYNPLDWLLENGKGKGEGRRGTKRSATEEDEDEEDDQPQQQRPTKRTTMARGDQAQAESSSMGRLRLTASNASPATRTTRGNMSAKAKGKQRA